MSWKSKFKDFENSELERTVQIKMTSIQTKLSGTCHLRAHIRKLVKVLGGKPLSNFCSPFLSEFVVFSWLCIGFVVGGRLCKVDWHVKSEFVVPKREKINRVFIISWVLWLVVLCNRWRFWLFVLIEGRFCCYISWLWRSVEKNSKSMKLGFKSKGEILDVKSWCFETCSVA